MSFRKPAPAPPILGEDLNFIPVPAGRRVKHLNVVATGDGEHVTVLLEEVPLTSVILAEVTVQR